MTLVKAQHPISRSFDGFFNDLFNDFPTHFGKHLKKGLYFPPVNITEKDGSYFLEVVAPGREKTDFNIKLEGNLLTISVEKKEFTTNENEKSIRKEYAHEAFSRSFTLDDRIDASTINARYEQGILTIQLPKKAAAKESSKEIAVS